MPNFKKARGGFSKKFAAKRADSPFEAADAGLMSAVGTSEAKSGHMGKVIEAMGKSERSSQIIDNVQKAAAMAAGVPPSAIGSPEGEMQGVANIVGKLGG